MLIEFLKILKNQGDKKFPVLQGFQKYPVCEVLVCVFARCILYHEYGITEALDFSTMIPDHMVYTALCDVFQYFSLKI